MYLWKLWLHQESSSHIPFVVSLWMFCSPISSVNPGWKQECLPQNPWSWLDKTVWHLQGYGGQSNGESRIERVLMKYWCVHFIVQWTCNHWCFQQWFHDVNTLEIFWPACERSFKNKQFKSSFNVEVVFLVEAWKNSWHIRVVTLENCTGNFSQKSRLLSLQDNNRTASSIKRTKKNKNKKQDRFAGAHNTFAVYSWAQKQGLHVFFCAKVCLIWKHTACQGVRCQHPVFTCSQSLAVFTSEHVTSCTSVPLFHWMFVVHTSSCQAVWVHRTPHWPIFKWKQSSANFTISNLLASLQAATIGSLISHIQQRNDKGLEHFLNSCFAPCPCQFLLHPHQICVDPWTFEHSWGIMCVFTFDPRVLQVWTLKNSLL